MQGLGLQGVAAGVGVVLPLPVARLTGRYFSYLLPKQFDETYQNSVNATQLSERMDHPCNTLKKPALMVHGMGPLDIITECPSIIF